ncbi:hypothetical protein HYFRA_00004261 [Hymenoscyphus fraxineus]|uniref:Uncharacterized protein n=1 Tax=Hymenoscyphus fraxineus TaxID=746836 RepID=A0A9N9KLJ0_9HELO|nr:hypothetical protein HYFRA_00004261 [Hymenoscyphus fraxineus]
MEWGNEDEVGGDVLLKEKKGTARPAAKSAEGFSLATGTRCGCTAGQR